MMGSRSTYVRGRFWGFQGRSIRLGYLTSPGPPPSLAANRATLTPSITADLEQPCSPSIPEAEPHLMEALCVGGRQPGVRQMGLRLS